MKNSLIIAMIFVSFQFFGQAISVSTNTYTTSQLVKDVLVNKNCVQIPSVNSITGTNYGSSNGIGYFENLNSSFPFRKGVILSTGDVTKAAGPNTRLLHDGNAAWLGDSELETALSKAGITMVSSNATVLEFDFVALTNKFGFDFIFASDDFGNSQCRLSDGIAFLLTNTTTGVTTNLAVVPNTSIPISTASIRDNSYNSNCSSENASFFGNFNSSSSTSDSATNFNGETVVMNASATVSPNVTYKLKIVIADGNDDRYDSALFLAAESFNLGQKVLGADLTRKNKTALCDQQTQTLISGLDPNIYSFAWTLNRNPIGGNTANLSISQTGIYELTYTVIATGCSLTDEVLIEYYDPLTVISPIDLSKCDTGLTSFLFNLDINTPKTLFTNDIITFHESISEAQSNTNSLPTSYSVNSSSLPKQVWIRVTNSVSKCFTIKSFNINKIASPTANKPNDLTLCENKPGGSKKANFNLDALTSTVLGTQSPLLYTVRFYPSNPDADAGTNAISSVTSYLSGDKTIYARVQNATDSSCFKITDFKLIVNLIPVLDVVKDQFVCNSYNLPTLLNPGNYYTGPNGSSQMLKAGDPITSNSTLYIYYKNPTTGCENERSFKIKIVKQADLQLKSDTFCDGYRIPVTSLNIRYFNKPGGVAGGGTEFLPNQVIRTLGSTTIYTYFVSTDTTKPICELQDQYVVKIFSTPVIVPIDDVFVCTSYPLPKLIEGNYYTYDATTKIYTKATSPITTTTQLHVFVFNNKCRSKDEVFTVFVGTFGLQDKKDECSPYNLTALPIGEYRDAANGGGNVINPGLITETTTIYTHVPGKACNPDVFTITINAPKVTVPPDPNNCGDYILPTNPDGADYYEKAGGPTTAGNVKLIPNVSRVKSSSTIYLYKPSTTLLGCATDKPWTITIEEKPKIDSRPSRQQCDPYTLTPLKNGDYYDDPNGINPIAPNTVIDKTNRIYIYKAAPVGSICPASEDFFDVTINGVVADKPPLNLNHCDSYTLPVLSANNFYYDAPKGPAGVGNLIAQNIPITAATVKPKYYIFTESKTTPNCTSEESFVLTVTPTPVANPVKAIQTCDDFTDNDGFFEFNLNDLAIRNQVLNGQTPDTDFDLTFYNSQNEANDPNAIPINNPTKYVNKTIFNDNVWIKVTNSKSAGKCFTVTELKLKVDLFPNPILLPDYYLCEDYKTSTLLNSVDLDCGVVGSDFKFEWSLDGVPLADNTAKINVTKPGNYEVKVTNIVSSCEKIATAKVTKYNPYIEVEYSDAFENPTFITVNVLGSNSGNFEYQLNNQPFQESNEFKNVPPGEYKVTARDKTGFCSPKSEDIIIINYPKYFTPNGDNNNETWNIKHLLASNPSTPIRIYDRFGSFLKEIYPSGSGWDGTLNGSPAQTGDYWFTVEFAENGVSKLYKSHFSLKR